MGTGMICTGNVILRTMVYFTVFQKLYTFSFSFSKINADFNLQYKKSAENGHFQQYKYFVQVVTTLNQIF